MNEFFTEYPPVVEHPFTSSNQQKIKPVDWEAAEDSLQVDQSVKDVSWAVPGKIFILNQRKRKKFC